MTTAHIPILVEPIIESLLEPFRQLPENAPAHWMIDCTLGGGGHTQAFLEALEKEPRLRKNKILAFDQDPEAVSRGRERFKKEITEGKLELHHSRISEILPELAEKPVLGLMADLGFSSDQVGNPLRGLSFQLDGPLDMRLDPSRDQTAARLLAQSGERELADILYHYGEERFSRRIALFLARARHEGKLPQTTQALAELVYRAIPPSARHGRIHPATRTFQALRIVVNDELKELDSLLERVIMEVKPGGRVAILSFHSLEDRRVKQAFRRPPYHPITKKPIEADRSELKLNPRARSAKLRIAVKEGNIP